MADFQTIKTPHYLNATEENPKVVHVRPGGGSLLLKPDSAETDGTNTLEDADLLSVGETVTVDSPHWLGTFAKDGTAVMVSDPEPDPAKLPDKNGLTPEQRNG